MGSQQCNIHLDIRHFAFGQWKSQGLFLCFEGIKLRLPAFLTIEITKHRRQSSSTEVPPYASTNGSDFSNTRTTQISSFLIQGGRQYQQMLWN
jgi:hypothetical protein